MTSPHCLRRATTAVLVAVAVISGATLLLGGNFQAGASRPLTQTVQPRAPVAACVAEENMRLITLDRERCHPNELELASAAAGPGRPGPVAAGVSGFDVVTAKVAVGARQTVGGEARCRDGKTAVGGGALPDPEGAGAGAERGMELAASGPLLPAGVDGAYGWMAILRNTGSSTLMAVVAAICVAVR